MNNKDYASNIHDYHIDVKNREIYLVGDDTNDDAGIDFKVSATFLKNLKILENSSGDKPITIHLNSPGGCCSNGFAIYDAIKASKCDITIIVHGQASSMASIILQAAEKRLVSPNALVVLHDGYASFEGSHKELKSFADYDKKLRAKMIEIYLEKCMDSVQFQGRTKTQVKKWLNDAIASKQDIYLIGQEIVDFGLADEVYNV